MKTKTKEIIGVALFYLFIILMLFIINARFDYLNHGEVGYNTSSYLSE